METAVIGLDCMNVEAAEIEQQFVSEKDTKIFKDSVNRELSRGWKVVPGTFTVTDFGSSVHLAVFLEREISDDNN